MKNVLAIALLLIGTAAQTPSHAQGQQPPKSSGDLGLSYTDMVKPRTTVSPLGNDLFGDKTVLYSGQTTFIQVDIDLPGNSQLPVRLARSLSIMSGHVHPYVLPGPMADWDLELPYVAGIYGAGWIVKTPGMPNNRCSVSVGTPENASPPNIAVAGYTFLPYHFWRGLSLHGPDGNHRTMLLLDPAAAKPASGVFYWGTQDRWAFACLPSTANSVPGEAFLGYSPDGLKYRFDWIVSKYNSELEACYGYSPVSNCAQVAKLGLSEYRALPTRIEDRFGNYVAFVYDPVNPWRLLSITANDGRAITLTYNGDRIATAVAGTRTWRYSFSNTGPQASPRLVAVELPDTSRWQFDVGVMPPDYGGWLNCADFKPPPSGAMTTATMVHPSGATGTFEFGYRVHGRVDVPWQCIYMGTSTMRLETTILTSISLTKKTITGSNLAPATWSFDYGSQVMNLLNFPFLDGCVTYACPTTRTLTVTTQDGNWDKYTFNQRYGDLEGKLLSSESGGQGLTLRSRGTVYKADARTSFGRIGTNPCTYCAKGDEFPTAVTLSTILQDGVLFRSQANSFDGFGRPTQVVKSSAPSP